jgi:membrane protein YdbS with pleckstrin-like domain
LANRRNVLASAGERIWLDQRPHGIVLARPLARAAALAATGAMLLALGWPATAGGAALLGLGAAASLRAVWRWERTRVVLTSEKLFVVHGTWRRRAAAVRLARVDPVEVEQTPLGRLLGYGTLVAGDLEIGFVPDPGRVYDLVARAAREAAPPPAAAEPAKRSRLVPRRSAR